MRSAISILTFNNTIFFQEVNKQKKIATLDVTMIDQLIDSHFSLKYHC